MIHPTAIVDPAAQIDPGARIGPYAVIGRSVLVEEQADVENAIIWPNTRIAQAAVVHGPIIGRNCHVGRNAVMKSASVIGDKTQLTDYTTL